MKRLIAGILLSLLCLSFGLAHAQAEWVYELPLSVVTGEYTILVNRDHLLGSADRPIELVSLHVRKKTSEVVQLDPVVAEALTNLFADATETTEYTYRVKNNNGVWETAVFSDPGGMQLLLVSGYRSYSSQNTIYHNYLARNGGVDDGISSPPGASEHQTGFACDVISVGYNNTHQYMNESFYETPEAQWMEEYAAAYGFIIRYPKDKEEITRVPYEPWHLRYVGRDIAGYIKRTGLSFEEFTDEWQAARDKFLEDGGDLQAQLLLESTSAPSTVQSVILDIYDEDGDPEVSLSLW